MDSEWKERGLGDSKLLRHRVSPSNICVCSQFRFAGPVGTGSLARLQLIGMCYANARVCDIAVFVLHLSKGHGQDSLHDETREDWQNCSALSARAGELSGS